MCCSSKRLAADLLPAAAPPGGRGSRSSRAEVLRPPNQLTRPPFTPIPKQHNRNGGRVLSVKLCACVCVRRLRSGASEVSRSDLDPQQPRGTSMSVGPCPHPSGPSNPLEDGLGKAPAHIQHVTSQSRQRPTSPPTQPQTLLLSSFRSSGSWEPWEEPGGRRSLWSTRTGEGSIPSKASQPGDSQNPPECQEWKQPGAEAAAAEGKSQSSSQPWPPTASWEDGWRRGTGRRGAHGRPGGAPPEAPSRRAEGQAGCLQVPSNQSLPSRLQPGPTWPPAGQEEETPQ